MVLKKILDNVEKIRSNAGELESLYESYLKKGRMVGDYLSINFINR